jgi:peptidoglycan/LPS O-acetylase OafA/YrhL
MDRSGTATHDREPKPPTTPRAPSILQRLSRVVAPGRRVIPEIDGLRFIAIGAVLLYHARAWVSERIVEADGALADQIQYGHYGVQLFFVISGFLLAIPFARWRLLGAPPPKLRTYFLRRLTRLEPPYIASFLLLFAAGLVIAIPGWAAQWPSLLASLAYQHNLVFGGFSDINCVAWSLEVEVQFYVLTPLLSAVFAIRPTFLRRGVLSIAIGLFAMGSVGMAAHGWWNLCLLGYLHEFLTGYLLADVFVSSWNEAPGRSWPWDVAAAVGWPALGALFSLPALVPFLLPPLVFLLYAAALRGPVTGWILRSPALVAIGGMCYTIYLLHYPLIALVGRVVRPLLPTSSFPLAYGAFVTCALPVVLAVSAAFFIVLERPCMDPEWAAKLAARVVTWLRSDRVEDANWGGGGRCS